jgi:SAM-dependent methyltransferase
MDRQAWLRERRQTAEERHDTIHAFTYDDQYGEIGPLHRRFVADLLERCPPGGTVLDAACGTGKYFAMVLDAGRRVVGTDQSTGMLARARARFPAVPWNGSASRSWPSRPSSTRSCASTPWRTSRPRTGRGWSATCAGPCVPAGTYLTVEQVDERELDEVFAEATARGLPVVRGEESRDGYHYYPSREQVGDWLEEGMLAVVAEDYSPGDGYGYLHLLTRAG